MFVIWLRIFQIQITKLMEKKLQKILNFNLLKKSKTKILIIFLQTKFLFENIIK